MDILEIYFSDTLIISIDFVVLSTCTIMAMNFVYTEKLERNILPKYNTNSAGEIKVNWS